MTDQRRHSVKNLQEFIDQMSRRRAKTPPALTEDPWGDDSVAMATSELPRPDAVPSGSTVGDNSDGLEGSEPRASRDSGRGRAASIPTNAHARAAATLGRGTVGPPTGRPPSDPALAADVETPPPSAETPAPEPDALAAPPTEPRSASKAPITDRVGRPPLRDSGRRLDKEAPSPPSERRIATERPEEREPLRWPVIILSALVAGGVIILTAVKAKEYTERTESTAYVATPPAEPAPSAQDPAAASGAASAPGTAPASEPPAAEPAASAASASTASNDPSAPAAPATVTAAPAPAGLAATAPRSEPAPPPELPSRVVAHIEAPSVLDKNVKEPIAADKAPTPSDKTAKVADKTPSATDRNAVAEKAPKPRPRPPVRAVKAAPPRPRPEAEPPRPERADNRPASDSKAEVAKVDPPVETPKPRPPEPAPAEPPAARPEPSPGPRAGTIDVAATRAAARTQIAPVQQCYERARMDDPSLAGTVQARITIAPDGAVARVEIASSTLGAPAVESCIRQAIARWRLPRPSGGASASLTYPLVFQ